MDNKKIEIPIRKNNEIQYVMACSNFNIFWHKNNPEQIKSFILFEDTVIQNIPCKGSSYITFYENGRLRNCFLKHKDLIYPTNSMKFRERQIKAEKNNKKVELVSDYYIEIQGLIFDSYTSICFHKNGNIWYGTPIENFRWGGLFYQGNTKIEFYPDCCVESGILLKHTIIEGICCKGGHLIHFDGSGTLRLCTLEKDYKYNNVIFQKDSQIYFFKEEIIYPMINTIIKQINDKYRYDKGDIEIGFYQDENHNKSLSAKEIW